MQNSYMLILVSCLAYKIKLTYFAFRKKEEAETRRRLAEEKRRHEEELEQERR